MKEQHCALQAALAGNDADAVAKLRKNYVPITNEDWKKIFLWIDESPHDITQDRADTLVAFAIRDDRADALQRMENSAPFACGLDKKTVLHHAFMEGADNVVRAVIDSLDDSPLAREWLNDLFICFARDRQDILMERALRAGADINAQDYAAWTIARDFRAFAMENMLFKWYARKTEINPQNPSCDTARKIRHLINDLRSDDGREVLLYANDPQKFSGWLATFEKNPTGDFAEMVVYTRDKLGNTPLDLLGERRALDLVFGSPLWNGREADMLRVWNNMPLIYQKRFDMTAEMTRRTQQRLKKNAPRKEWRL